MLHESLMWRLRSNDEYKPLNNHGDDFMPCLKHEGRVAEVEAVKSDDGEEVPGEHRTYKFTTKHKREMSFPLSPVKDVSEGIQEAS